jgi:1,4-alpha-glucan branching enzyme
MLCVPKTSYVKKSRKCKVTFELPPEVDAASAAVVGDFNGWSPSASTMTKRKDGRFSTTLTLDSGREYRYRFLLDGERWENDWQAHAYVLNEFGSEDSVVKV